MGAVLSDKEPAEKTGQYYKTAKATMACAKFNAGDYVSITFSHTANGVTWFLVTGSEHVRKFDFPVAYRREWLTNFCL